MIESTSLHRKRFPALDGLRGIAILAVLGHNLQLLQDPTSLASRAVEEALDRGWIGVQLFFVLSGFLITGILLDTRTSKNYLASFFARRALRIFPLYFLSLIVLLVLLPMLGLVSAPMIPEGSQQWPYWLYFSNWTQPGGYGGGVLTHFWSLAVEEQFYLLWPFLLRRGSAAGVLRLCVGVALAALLARLWLLHDAARPDALYMYSVSRMDALALGGAAAAALRIDALSRWLADKAGRLAGAALVLAVAGAVLTHGYPRLGVVDQSVGYGLLSLTLAFLVLAAAVADMSAVGGVGGSGIFSLLRLAPLRTFGTYSYGIYVLHKPLNDLVGVPLAHAWLAHESTDVMPTIVYLVVITLVSLGLATLSYRFIEMPFLRLKTRFAAAAPGTAGRVPRTQPRLIVRWGRRAVLAIVSVLAVVVLATFIGAGGRHRLDNIRLLWVDADIDSGSVRIDPERVHYTVASTHPRILLNHVATLDRLKAQWRGNAPEAVRFQRMVDGQMAGEPVYEFKPWFAALLYRVTGEQRYADYAVAQTDAFVASEEALVASGQPAYVAYDSYLYVGPIVANVALVYDWCFDSLRPEQRKRWLAYSDQAVWNVWHPGEASWGGRIYRWTGWSVNNPSNNYYYSFLRATMLLGLASHSEDPQARTWLEIFRVRKLEMQLFPTFEHDLAGGGSREGTGYGVAMRSLFEMFDWWEKSTGERLADRTPHTLASEASMMHAIVPTLDQVVPNGDHSRDPSAKLFDYERAYLLTLMALFPQERLSGMARTTLEASSVKSMRAGFDYYIDYLYAPTVAPLPIDLLSTTYWASGTGQLQMRSSWSSDATFANVVCGPYTESHAHRDQASFLIYRNGWLANDANMQTREGLESGESLHNLVRFESDGRVVGQSNNAEACTLKALVDNERFTYLRADATAAYGSRKGIGLVRRDMLFIKPDSFVLLDRSSTAPGIRPIFTLNLPGPPALHGNTLTLEQGAARLDVIRLAPSGAQVKVVPWATQGNDVQGGFRVDETPDASLDAHDDGGGAMFLHAIGTSGSVVSAEASETSESRGMRLHFKDGRRALVRFDSELGLTGLQLDGPDGTILFDGPLQQRVVAPPLFADKIP